MFMRSTALAVTFVATGAHAQTTPDQIDALYDALALPEVVEIMRAEGKAYGDQIAGDLFAGSVSATWTQTVADIYATDRLEGGIKAALGTSLADTDVTPIIAFFTSEQGQRIVELEVSAREAFLDDAVEDASKEVAAMAAQNETPRFLQIKDYIEANDLIEANVAGALNANFAFYLGLIDGGGGFTAELTEEQVIADVWGQEDEIRTNTGEWVYSYLMLAYQPLSDNDVDAYIAFSQSAAGQDLNTALFSAFDQMFIDVSRALGRGASEQMAGADL